MKSAPSRPSSPLDREPIARLVKRVAGYDWAAVEADLGARGHARMPALLDARECRELVSMYRVDARFRSRVDMGRHRFGEGDYAYFAEPLPEIVGVLRRDLYARLAPIANRMSRALGRSVSYPRTLAAYARACRAAGQTRPTPLLLRYRAGGYNRLHRDLYGSLAFPLQATVLLSRPRVDFEGGEFLLVEDRPRQQARGEAIALERGEAIIFPVRDAAVRTEAGTWSRATVRHGVSRVNAGERYALGIIFHNAA